MKCDKAFKEKNCLSDGKYCSMGSIDLKDDESTINGKDQVIEDLRGYCVVEHFKNLTWSGEIMFFEYVEKMHLLCGD